jgi:hypothetical protein
MPRPLNPDTRKTAVGAARSGGGTGVPGAVFGTGRFVRTSSARFMRRLTDP